MDQFTPKNIALLLIALGVLWYAVQEFFAWCRRNDEEWVARNPAPDSDQRQQEVAAEHVAKRSSGHSAKILGDMIGLRRDLPPARNMTGAAQAEHDSYRMNYGSSLIPPGLEEEIQRQMPIDTHRVTKL